MMSGGWANLVWVVVLCFVVTLAILAVSPTPVPKSYAVIESGAYVSSIGGGEIGWINNEEVMFLSTHDSQSPKPGVFLPHGIFIWKMGEGIRLYRSNVGNLRMGNERIWYWMKPDEHGDSKEFWGVPGSETEVGSYDVERMTLQRYKLSGNPHKIRRMPLLPGHGVLVTDSDNDDRPAKFYAEGDDKGVDTPFTNRLFKAVRYIPFKQAYLIERLRDNEVGNRAPAGTPLAAWWLRPDGSFTEFNLPKGWEYQGDFFPVKNGWLFEGYDQRVDLMRFPRDTGLYLIEPDGQVTTLIQPMPKHTAVSPDGCHVAFTHTKDLVSGPMPSTLKVISLC